MKNITINKAQQAHKLIESGLHPERACKMAGICVATYKAWKRDPDEPPVVYKKREKIPENKLQQAKDLISKGVTLNSALENLDINRSKYYQQTKGEGVQSLRAPKINAIIKEFEEICIKNGISFHVGAVNVYALARKTFNKSKASL